MIWPKRAAPSSWPSVSSVSASKRTGIGVSVIAITDSGLSALIADNYAVEAYPARPGGACCAILPLHEHCLFKLGLPLGELWHLTPLADWLRTNGRHRFLLTAPPLRLPGAVGSPATPIATV